MYFVKFGKLPAIIFSSILLAYFSLPSPSDRSIVLMLVHLISVPQASETLFIFIHLFLFLFSRRISVDLHVCLLILFFCLFKSASSPFRD